MKKIPKDWQAGIQWRDDEGRLCTTDAGYIDKATGKREATLIETTYVGSCAITAMHYYARIRVSNPGWRVEGDAPGIIRGGYGGKAQPKLDVISIDAKRTLRRREKDAMGDPIGKAGDETIRFNNPEDAREVAIKFFKEHFGPGWVLKSDDDCTKIIAET